MRFEKKLLNLSVLIVILLTVILPHTIVYGAEFSDLSSSNFAYDAIMQLASRGIVNGYDDGKFYPDNSLKRSEFCKLITTAMNVDTDSYSSKKIPFSDINDGYWGRNYIYACYDKNLINGMGDGTFDPENTITYEQAVKIAVCAAGLEEEAKAASNSDSKWYSGYLETAGNNGILANTSGVIEKPISRACASQIIYNTFFEKENSKGEEVKPSVSEEPVALPTPKPTATPAPTAAPSESVNTQQAQRPSGFVENLVFIDAGHNYDGSDTGARGSGLKEEEVTWQIANKLKTMLEKNGFTVIMSREAMTSSVANTSVNESLYKRCEMANSAMAEIFISIHCNAGGGTGVETYCYSETSSGYELAKAVQKNIVETADMRDRKVKTANFVVIRETLMPAILVETGFIDREEDALVLGSESGQAKIAEGIAKGVCEYKNVLYIN